MESFQHANVFGCVARGKPFFRKLIYIILTFEVNYKQKTKHKINLNNLYENNV